MTPVIIEAAINGVTNKTRNPHVPCMPEEIAADALACLEAGAAIVHNHVDVMYGGETIAARQLEGWRPVLAAATGRDSLSRPSGSAATSCSATRTSPLLAEAVPMRMSVFDPGSVNLGGVGRRRPAGRRARFRLHEQLRRHPPHGGSSAISTGSARASRSSSRAFCAPRWRIIAPDACRPARSSSSTSAVTPTTSAAPAAASASGCRRRARRSTPISKCSTAAALPWAVAVIGGDVVDIGPGAAGPRARRPFARRPRGLRRRAPAAQRRARREAVALARSVGRPIASCREAASLLGLPR